jgi:hypothetical protein
LNVGPLRDATAFAIWHCSQLLRRVARLQVPNAADIKPARIIVLTFLWFLLVVAGFEVGWYVVAF